MPKNDDLGDPARQVAGGGAPRPAGRSVAMKSAIGLGSRRLCG